MQPRKADTGRKYQSFPVASRRARPLTRSRRTSANLLLRGCRVRFLLRSPVRFLAGGARARQNASWSALDGPTRPRLRACDQTARLELQPHDRIASSVEESFCSKTHLASWSSEQGDQDRAPESHVKDRRDRLPHDLTEVNPAHLATNYGIMRGGGRNDNGTNHQVYLEKAALWRFLSSQHL